MKSSSHTHRSASSSTIRLASVLLAWLTFTGLTTAAVLLGADFDPTGVANSVTRPVAEHLV